MRLPVITVEARIKVDVAFHETREHQPPTKINDVLAIARAGIIATNR